MIDDDDIAFERLLMHARDEAPVELGALLTAATIRAGIDLGPRAARFRERFDFGAIAGFAGFFPLADDLKIGDFFQSFEHGLAFGVVNFLPAGVIRPAFHIAGAKRAQMLLKERNVLEEKLFLQILGAGGDDHSLARQDGGNQIGERFAGACAGFDDQMFFIGERGFDSLRHFELAVAILVVRVPFGKQTFPAEELPNG